MLCDNATRLCCSNGKLKSFCLADSDGCVCGSTHLLNITLTMHRLLISSSDLLDKLITLYPSAAHHKAITTITTQPDGSNNGLANFEHQM